MGMRIAVAVAIVLVGLACFMIGLLMRRHSDQELIEQLEAELEARAEIAPAELAPEEHHEPRSPAELRAAYPEIAGRIHDIHGPGTTCWCGYRPVILADTVWDLPAVRLDGIDELGIWTATLIASTDRFMIQLGLEPGTEPGNATAVARQPG